MSLRILFVDDEPAIRFALEIYLGNREYDLDLAEDFATAESLLLTRAYDAVLTDLRLSGRDKTEGLDIIRLTRQRMPNAKTVLLTAYGSPAVEAEARALGVDLYLQKPIALAELERRLRVILRLPFSAN